MFAVEYVLIAGLLHVQTQAAIVRLVSERLISSHLLATLIYFLLPSVRADTYVNGLNH